MTASTSVRWRVYITSNMIRTIADLQEYLLADKIALGRKDSKPPVFDFIWRFEISLRYLEYYHNLMHCNLFQHFFLKYWQVRYIINSIICGFEIPLNVFGKGLSIAHKGTIVVNGAARIGENCRIHTCVNIGTLPGTSNVAPIIGNDVYIGPGAKIWGGYELVTMF